MVELIIQKGADVNIQDNIGMTPAMEAVFWDKIEILQKILVKKPNLTLVDHKGQLYL